MTAVLPADYGIDPTGAGRYVGLVEMGETKVKLASEAEADRKAAFDGKHGWFWRNRGQKNVILTLNTQGQYSGMNGVP